MFKNKTCRSQIDLQCICVHHLVLYCVEADKKGARAPPRPLWTLSADKTSLNKFLEAPSVQVNTHSFTACIMLGYFLYHQKYYRTTHHASAARWSPRRCYPRNSFSHVELTWELLNVLCYYRAVSNRTPECRLVAKRHVGRSLKPGRNIRAR